MIFLTSCSAETENTTGKKKQLLLAKTHTVLSSLHISVSVGELFLTRGFKVQIRGGSF